MGQPIAASLRNKYRTYTRSQLLLVPSKDASDQDIGHQAGMSKRNPSDRRRLVMQQPVLHCSSLIGMPVCSNHWLCHDFLQNKGVFLSMRAFRLLLMLEMCAGDMLEFLQQACPSPSLSLHAMMALAAWVQ